MTQTAKLHATKRNKPASSRFTNGEDVGLRNRPSPNAPARRKRQFTQRVRRLEATVSTLSRSAKQWRPRWSLPRLVQFGFSGWHTSKVISSLLLLSVAGALVWMHIDDHWFVYRESVRFNGVSYLNTDKLYAASGIDSWNIFWLQPETVRQRLLALPYVAEVKVQTNLPNQVTISVQEAEPAALWVTDEGMLWLLPDGTARPAQGSVRQDIPQIIDGAQEAKAVDTRKGLAMDQNILKSALALKQQLPEIEQLRFNKDFGLNFHLPSSSAWVYWGDGYQTAAKFTNLAAIQSLIQAGKAEPQIIDLRFDRPYMH